MVAKNSMPSLPRPVSHWHAALCSAVLACCVLMTRPFVEMGVNDDWSYIRTAQVLAETGQVVYNGWATAMLGWQLFLGALFIRLFGFSFTVVRLPIFLLALVTTYLLHRVLVRFGLNAGNAVLATLTVVLSPIFLPMAFSFMSDVGGLFCLLLCLYACQRALSAGSDRAALCWLYFAALSNVLDGTVRQIAWLGVLIMVPCTAWLMRNRKSMLWHGAALWVIGFASILAGMHWYAHQPYAAVDKMIDGPINRQTMGHLVSSMVRAVLSLCLFASPVLGVFPPAILKLEREKARRAFAGAGCVVAILVVCVYVAFHVLGHFMDTLLFPWLLNIVTIHGLVQFGEALGHQAIDLNFPVRAGLSLAAVILGACAVAYVAVSARRGPDERLAFTGQATGLSGYQTGLLLVPFSLAYLGLLAPRAAFHALFDRYLTPLVLVLAVLLLRYLQSRSARGGYLLSFAVLFVISAYSVASLHDLYSLDRARVAAAEEVTRSGVARTALEGGFEYDGWTQITAGKYVNDPHIRVPAGAFRPLPEVDLKCHSFFTNWTPLVQPEYALAFEPYSCFQPSDYSSVPYGTWLPPYDRRLYVQKVR